MRDARPNLYRGDESIGPILRLLHKSSPNGILENVIGFFASALVGSQTVVAPNPLPSDAQRFSRPRFPIANHLLHGGRGAIRESEEAVEVIWHDDECGAPPDFFLVAVFNGSDQGIGDVFFREDVLS